MLPLPLPQGLGFDLQAHDDRNLARKLTPAEKKEKKERKLTGQAFDADAPLVRIYRVTSLADRKHRYLVSVNAEVSSAGCTGQELHCNISSTLAMLRMKCLARAFGVQKMSRDCTQFGALGAGTTPNNA